MATRIKATCANCGDIFLTNTEVEIRIAEDDSWSVFGFYCKTCETHSVHEADPATIRILEEVGVRTITVPIETGIPPLTLSSISEFSIWLEKKENLTVNDILEDSGETGQPI